MADRYWVGGSGTWSSTNTTNWSTASGQPGGASVPTATDSVFFDSGSGSTFTVTVAANYAANCLDLNVVSGVVGMTLAFGASNATTNINIYGSLAFPTTGLSITATQALFIFRSTSTGKTINANGVSITCSTQFNGVGGGWTLSSAYTGTGGITFSAGTLTTNNNNITTAAFLFTNASTSFTLAAGTSTITFTGNVTATTGSSWGNNTSDLTNFTLTGTSTIVASGANGFIWGTGKTYSTFQFTSTNIGTWNIQGSNTFTNFTVDPRGSTGVNTFQLYGNQTISSTLTVQSGNTTEIRRTRFVSDTVGTQRTMTVAATSGMFATDFRDINFAGAASPLSGTSLNFGDGGGNAGLTFPAAKTVYRRVTGNWSATQWADAASGGNVVAANFPLGQDTAVFNANTTAGTHTIDASWWVYSVDMTNTTAVTLAFTNPLMVYGNWTNGANTTISNTSTLTFAGAGAQTLTPAGRTFTASLVVNKPVGTTLTLQASTTTSSTFTLTQGTLDLNGTTLTTTGGFSSSGTTSRTITFGGGTISSGAGWTATTATNLTISGTGTITMTSASAKTFAGGGTKYLGITLNQGGTGALTISGSNQFASMTNTAIGSVLFTASTTNDFFTSFALNGAAGNLLTLSSTTTTNATIRAPYSPWYVGTNTTLGTGATGFDNTSTTVSDYLNISRLTGRQAWTGTVAETGTGADTPSVGPSTFKALLAETGSGADSTALVALFKSQVAETGAGVDTAAALTDFGSVVSEVVTGADALFVGPSTFNAALDESSSVADAAFAYWTTTSAVDESSSVADEYAALFLPRADVAETVSGADTVETVLAALGTVSEATTGTDTPSVGPSTFKATLAETATGTDTAQANTVFISNVAESGNISDLLAAAFLWSPIDDDQTPNWTGIGNSQTPTWTSITNTQAPGWNEIDVYDPNE